MNFADQIKSKIEPPYHLQTMTEYRLMARYMQVLLLLGGKNVVVVESESHKMLEVATPGSDKGPCVYIEIYEHELEMVRLSNTVTITDRFWSADREIPLPEKPTEAEMHEAVLKLTGGVSWDKAD